MTSDRAPTPDSIEALVTALTSRHLDLYRTNQFFKASIDTLARTLPIWVDGLASNAVEVQADHLERVRLAKMAPPAPMTLTENDDGTFTISPPGDTP